MKTLSLRALAFTIVALTATACGPFHRGSANEAAIVFENASVNQAAVYAVMPGTNQVRLGTVLPGQTETLRIPSTITGRATPVNIVARLLAGSSHPETGAVSIRPGDAYHVRLTNSSVMLTMVPVEADEP
jgi:hypothetical protein